MDGIVNVTEKPGDREGHPYISCRNSGQGYVGATLAVARCTRHFGLNHAPYIDFWWENHAVEIT